MIAASSIGQYEKSVHALADYYRTVELGLGNERWLSLKNPYIYGIIGKIGHEMEFS